jgi:hypothetical protein
MLKLDAGSQGANVVAEVKRTGGAVASQDGTLVCVCHERESRTVETTSHRRAEMKMPPGLAASRLQYAWENGPPDSGVPPTMQIQRGRFRIHGLEYSAASGHIVKNPGAPVLPVATLDGERIPLR